MAALQLAFEHYGDDSHQPLIILHGFLGSARNWRQLAKRFSQYWHVYVPDLRNHGSSPHHPCMDYPALTGDVISFLDERHLSRAHCLGHSMGGKIAMWLALNHSERLNKLIVADIAPIQYAHNFASLFRALQNLPLANLKNRKQAEALLAKDMPDLSYRQFLLQNLNLAYGQYQWRINLNFIAENANLIAGFPNNKKLPPYRKEALFIT